MAKIDVGLATDRELYRWLSGHALHRDRPLVEREVRRRERHARALSMLAAATAEHDANPPTIISERIHHDAVHEAATRPDRQAVADPQREDRLPAEDADDGTHPLSAATTETA